MKNNTRTYFLLALAFFLANTNITVLAENTLPTVNVIGEAQNERRQIQQEIFFKPFSKHVIGEKTIAEENIPNIADAVRDIPGVTITESGAFSQTIRIRGLEGPRVTTLIDGIKLSNQGMTHTGSAETGMVDIANVKRIEVIQGSPAVIFDPGASGGVINIITQSALLERGIGFKQTVRYDEGYDLTKHTTVVDASNGNIGARFTFSKTDSNDYKIKAEDEKNLAIEKNNLIGPRSATFIRTDDLGYHTESTKIRISAKAGQDGIIDIDWEDWAGNDMVLIHGPSIADATIVQYDRMDRELQAISYRKDTLGSLSNFHMKYAKQSQFQAIGALAKGVTLNSQQVNLISDLTLNNLNIKFGGEIILDDAETLIYSEQDYYAVFTNLDYIIHDWTFFGGVRWNRWATRQKLLDGANADIAEQLVGISGSTPEQKHASPTMALGVQYAINDNNNVSINLNTTYRNPDLMERYSFGNIIGGGINLQPEEGTHAEISWKHLGNELSFSTSIFYSDFKNYLWTKSVRNLKPGGAAGIAECTRLGLCDPINGDFNDRASDFFDIFTKHYNAEEVSNWGMAFSAQYSIPQHEIIFGASFNQIESDDIHVKSAAHPIDTTISYRFEFNNAWQPWIKIKAQYVLDVPTVEQHLGFDPYFLSSLHTGFSKNGFIVSAGIRNILNETYRAPYSGIPGLARSFFISGSYQWSSRGL